MGNKLTNVIDLSLIGVVVGGTVYIIYSYQKIDVPGMLNKVMGSLNKLEGKMIDNVGNLSEDLANEIPEITKNVIRGVLGVADGVVQGIGDVLNPSDARTFGQWWNSMFGVTTTKNDDVPFHDKNPDSIIEKMRGIVDVHVKEKIEKQVSSVLGKYYSGNPKKLMVYKDDPTYSILTAIKAAKPEKIGWYTSLVTNFVTRYYYNKHYLPYNKEVGTFQARDIYSQTEDDVFTYFFLLVVGGEFKGMKTPKKKNLTYSIIEAIHWWGKADVMISGMVHGSGVKTTTDSFRKMGVDLNYNLPVPFAYVYSKNNYKNKVI